MTKYDDVFAGITGKRPLDPNEVFEKLEQAGAAWMDAKKIYSQLDKSKKAVLARIARKSGEESVAAREQMALASDEWAEFLMGLAEAEHEMNRLKLHYEHVNTWTDLKKSQQSVLKELIDKGFLLK